MTSRAWCFTVNNPTGPLHFETGNGQLVRYAIYQEEVGEEGGTRHFQGYVELSKPARFTQVRALHPELERAHFEKRQGTREQARDYCRKAETRHAGPWEFGTWIEGQGERTDLASVKRALDDGHSDLQVANAHFEHWVRYRKAFSEYRMLITPDRKEKTQVWLMVGDPGTGKSKKALTLFPEAYWKPRGKWWDGYQGQETVILDDFYGWLTWDELLRIMDRYPYQCETKGATTRFLAKHLVITSNSSPDNWYRASPNIKMEAFYRRVDIYKIFPPLQNGQIREPWTLSQLQEPDWLQRMGRFRHTYGQHYPLMNQPVNPDDYPIDLNVE